MIYIVLKNNGVSSRIKLVTVGSDVTAATMVMIDDSTTVMIPYFWCCDLHDQHPERIMIAGRY